MGHSELHSAVVLMGLAFISFELQVTLPDNRLSPTAFVNVLKVLGRGVLRTNAGDYCRGEHWWTSGAPWRPRLSHRSRARSW